MSSNRFGDRGWRRLVKNMTPRKAALVASALALVAAGAGVAIADDSAVLTPAKAGLLQNGPNTAVTGQRKPPPASPGPVAVDPPLHANQIVTVDKLAGTPLPFSPGTIDVANAYLGTYGQDYVSLFAGADPAAPADGLVVVQVDDAGGGTPVWPSSTVRLPGAGAVKLQSVLGSQVTLLDAHGLVHVLSLLNDAAN